MKFTTGKHFLDTNFLLYCFSADEPLKRDRCRAILQEGKEEAIFVLSTQVIKEFTSVMLSKYRMNPLEVKKIIADFAAFETVQVDLDLIQKGIDNHLLYHYSFWDSLIIAAAQSAQCNMLLSEDMRHGQEINGLKIWNPFR